MMSIKSTMACLAAMMLACAASANAQGLPKPVPRVAPPSTLVILAHPDDEIIMAPVLNRLARSDGEVTVVFATSGDAGPGVSGLEPGDELARLREDEARCSAFALRLPEPQFWQLGDGTLADTPRAADSPAKRLAGKISAIIAEMQPQVIMTWGPDGGYGHGDHRMVSNAVTQVVQTLDEDRPDLLYSAIPNGRLPPMAEFENWATTHPSMITDRIEYDPPDLEAARNAIACYESQFSPEARAGLADLLHQTIWRGRVFFRMAFVPDQ
ncbi:MAG: PIG-L family deacetylase [Pseudomonadota bacterium]